MEADPRITKGERAVLEGQVALVTGGGSGIGRAIAIRFADSGAHAIVASRTRERLDETVAEIRDRGGSAERFVANVRNRSEVDKLAEWILATYGRIDVLVNNAGGQFLAPILGMSEKGWKAVIDLNLHGTFNCLQVFGRVMVRQRSGRIVNIITSSSLGAAPGRAHSGAARSAVASLTRSAAAEWANASVRVNAVAPGPIWTSGLESELSSSEHVAEVDRLRAAVPLGRLGTPSDVADAVQFIVSPASDFITGHILVVDGGFSLGGTYEYTSQESNGGLK